MSDLWPVLAGLIQAAAKAPFFEAATFTPTGGAPESITGSFTGEHVRQELTEIGLEVSTSAPKLGVHLADFSQTPVAGDGIVFGSTSYLIAEVQTDGQGDADLVLRLP